MGEAFLVDQKSKNWRELIKPKRIEINQGSYANNYGKFVCEPLERGFGITLGNSLRRVLLSALQGAAIVSVKFDEVLHDIDTSYKWHPKHIEYKKKLNKILNREGENDD